MKKLALAMAIAGTTLAGQAMAATLATYDVEQDITVSGLASGSGTGTGTGVLDDSGVLTMELSGEQSTDLGGDITTTSTIEFTGTWDGGSLTFTPSSGTSTVNSCEGSATSCGAITIGEASAFSSVGGSVTALPTLDGGGTLTSSQPQFGGQVNVDSTYELTQVPVPAAAWLFGSGLVGLAGIARRRKAAAV